MLFLQKNPGEIRLEIYRGRAESTNTSNLKETEIAEKCFQRLGKKLGTPELQRKHLTKRKCKLKGVK